MSDSFLSTLAADADQPIRVIVRYANADAMSAINSLAAGAETGVAMGRQFELIPAQVVSGSPQALRDLEKSPLVDRIWEDLPVHTMLDVSTPKIHAPQMWNLGFDGSGVKVAVVDTGIDRTHPDFEDRIVATQDFTDSSPDAVDGNGHGTHVASTIAGSGSSSGGRYIGVAPEALLLVAKVLKDNGSGMTSGVMAGVDWAVQQGAQVINLSLGSNGPCDGSDALSALCDEAVSRGVVVCVAAGNSGPDASTVGSPGCARQVITVGATNDGDQVTSFSSRGPTGDGRVKPDVCFPGYGIVAARAHDTSMGTPIDASYTSASGTSMATPHASGAAALLVQAHPGMTPAEVKQRLMATAVDLGLDGNTQGAGRGDAVAAHVYVPPAPPPTPTPTPPPTPTPTPTPTPQPGGCSPFASAQGTQGGMAKEFWWILGILLILCVCVTCASAALIGIALRSISI